MLSHSNECLLKSLYSFVCLSVYLSVRVYTCNNSRTAQRIFVIFNIISLYEKVPGYFKFGYNLIPITDILT